MNNIYHTPTDNELKETTYICTAESFELGTVVITQGINDLLCENRGANLSIYLNRHKNGDWGDTPIEDKIANDEATKMGSRIVSAYQFCGERILIITEWDRSVTTILLSFEY